MINVSSNFRRKLAMDDRAYLEKVDLTLKDGTVLHLTNADIWGGSLSIDDSVGSDNSFTALGACVVNSLKFTINNIYDDFSDYDFMDAVAVVQIGLDDVNDGDPEYVDKGVFTVVDPTYNGSTISIVAHDNMSKFDKPYSASSLVYPADLDTIVRNLCYVCDVDLATSSLNFPRKDYVIPTRPSDEAVTCREVLSWCAIIAGCYARCNVDGDLELKWFDTDTFDTAAESLDGGRFDNHDPNVYVTGDDADGGVFNPWVSGDGDAYDGGSFDYSTINLINSMYSQNISVDDVVITQVKVEVKVKSDTGEAIETYTEGQSGYTVKIAPNDFITTDNAQYIVGVLGTELIGLKFRKANVSHPSDPTIEAGDCAFVYDRKGNRYQILVTRTNFTVGSAQTTVCGADTPAKNSAARFSEATKSYVEIRHQLIEQKSEWEEAVEDLEEQIANAGGLYETQVQQTGGGVVTYLHNKPILAESDIQIQVSDVGVHVTANGTAQSPTWYGLDVNGVLIAAILNTIGINASWINSGQLVIKDQNNNETFFADTATGVVRINATQLTINSNPVPSSADLNDAKKVATNYLSYNNNDGITLGYVNTNEKINIDADGMELYDGSNNQIAQFKAVARLGLANKANLRLDYHSLQLQDTNGNTYVHLSDLRDNTGYASVTDVFVGNGSTRRFDLNCNLNAVSDIQSVKIDNVETSNYTVNLYAQPYSDTITFSTAPPDGSMVEVNYRGSSALWAYTFGTRNNSRGLGHGSFVNGNTCVADSKYSHAEGYTCIASGIYSHAEGYSSKATGEYAHTEGISCTASGKYSHAEGYTCIASGPGSHAEGDGCKAQAISAHAEGSNCTASGVCSHAEGNGCTVSYSGGHAEGDGCTVSGYCAHAEGHNCTATKDYSHAEGDNCTASGNSSHAEGMNCSAKGGASHASGWGVISATNYQQVFGQNNVETSTSGVNFIVGGGTTSSNRKNTLVLNTSGNMTIAGTLTQSSDKRLKHHRAYLSDQQDQVNEFINRLKPAWFEKDEQKHLGFYAQDVQQTDRWQCMVDNDTNGYLTLGYTELLAPLVAYCQNLEQKVESLEQRIERLEQLLNQQ